MGTELNVIVGMAVVTVGSGISQMILKALGKIDESQIVDFVTKCLLTATCCTVFAAAIKAMLGLIGDLL